MLLSMAKIFACSLCLVRTPMTLMPLMTPAKHWRWLRRLLGFGQRSHTGNNPENAIGNEMADIICNARRFGQGLGVAMFNTDCGDQRVTVTLRTTRVISDLRRAMWMVLQTDHLTNWMSSSHWPNRQTKSEAWALLENAAVFP